MTVSGRSLLKVAIVFAMALAGVTLMIRVDSGTVWLKFALYSVSLVAIFLAALFSPAKSGGCGWPFFRRQTKG